MPTSLALFDVVIESSKVGVRKPDPASTSSRASTSSSSRAEAVFLDDLGINLKPARAMGMTTIKVGRPRRRPSPSSKPSSASPSRARAGEGFVEEVLELLGVDHS